MNSRQLGEARKAELDLLVERHGGTVTPEQIVAFAARETTALHSLFEWDDTEAARKYRLVQAEQYLRVVVAVIPNGDDQPRRVRAFVSLPSDRGANGYRRTVDVMQDPERCRELLAQAQAEYQQYRKRFQHLKELVPLFEAGDAVFAVAA